MKKKNEASILETTKPAQAKKLFVVLKRFSTNKQVTKMRASDLRNLQLAVAYVVELIKSIKKNEKPA